MPMFAVFATTAAEMAAAQAAADNAGRRSFAKQSQCVLQQTSVDCLIQRFFFVGGESARRLLVEQNALQRLAQRVFKV